MGRRVVDLHPDDWHAREAIRARLHQLRQAAGLTQRQAGQGIDMCQAVYGRLERFGVDQSKTSTVARWARSFGYRLVLEPLGFPKPFSWRRQEVAPTMRIVNALIETRNTAALGGLDGYHAAKTVRDLIGIRVACGVSQNRLAAVLDVTDPAVSMFERYFCDNQLVVLQRYARGVARAGRRPGAYLAVRLEELPAPDSQSVPVFALQDPPGRA